MEKKTSKRYYRCHAHTNPFRDQKIDLCDGPESVQWDKHFKNGKPPVYLDIGCGYGRFLFKTAEMNPKINILGLEIRDKVVEFLKLKTDALDNCSVLQTNALLFLPNFFKPNSLEKIFVLFADPHFKKRKQKGRVICRQMMNIFKYLLKPSGQVYISTDVTELFEDMCNVFETSGKFERDESSEKGELFEMSYKDTDEAHRAGVKSGHTYGRVYKVIN